jgi:hypothetical protein
MAAPGQVQLPVVSLVERCRSHGIRHYKLDAWRSGRPTPLGEAPASGLGAVTLNRTRQFRPKTAKFGFRLPPRWQGSDETCHPGQRGTLPGLAPGKLKVEYVAMDGTLYAVPLATAESCGSAARMHRSPTAAAGATTIRDRRNEWIRAGISRPMVMGGAEVMDSLSPRRDADA